MIKEDTCLEFGNKELDPLKNEGGVLQVRQSGSGALKRYSSIVKTI